MHIGQAGHHEGPANIKTHNKVFPSYIRVGKLGEVMSSHLIPLEAKAMWTNS